MTILSLEGGLSKSRLVSALYPHPTLSIQSAAIDIGLYCDDGSLSADSILNCCDFWLLRLQKVPIVAWSQVLRCNRESKLPA